MHQVRVAVPCLLFLLSACGGTSPDVTPPVQPPVPPVAGSYTLASFNGASIPARPASNIVIDTGYATLWPSGYYEMYVRRFTSGSPENYIVDNGYWSTANGAIQFVSRVTTGGAIESSGHFTVTVVQGNVQLLVFRRVGDAPPPPVRPFGVPNPTYSATLRTDGSGSAMTITGTLTVGNPDVIARTVVSISSCQLFLWLQTDSTQFSSPAWSDYYQDSPDFGCRVVAITDTIPVGGQRAYADSRRVGELRNQPSNVLLPSGRYYAWLLSNFQTPAGTVKARLGWITIVQSGR